MAVHTESVCLMPVVCVEDIGMSDRIDSPPPSSLHALTSLESNSSSSTLSTPVKRDTDAYGTTSVGSVDGSTCGSSSRESSIAQRRRVKPPGPILPNGTNETHQRTGIEPFTLIEAGKHTFVCILRRAESARSKKVAGGPLSSHARRTIQGFLCMREVQSKLLDSLPRYKNRSEQSSRSSVRQELEKLHYKAIEADKGEIGILKSKKVIKHNAPGTSLYSVGQVCKFLGYEGLESIGAAIEATFEDWCQQKGYDIADGEVTDEPPPPPTVTRTPRKKGRSARSDNRPRKAIKRAKYEEDDDFTSDAAAEGDVEPDEEDTIMQVATAGPSSSRPNSRAYQRATPTVTIDQEMVAATAQAQPSHDNATQMPHVGRRRQRTPSSRFSRDQLFGSTDLTSTSSVGMDLGVDPSPAALAAAPAPIVIGSGIVAPAASHMNIVNDDIHGHSASAPPPKLFGPSWSSFHPRLNVPRSTSTYGVSYGPQAPFTVGQFGSTLPVSSVPPPLHHVGHTRDPSLLPSGMEFEAAQARDARVWAEVNYANHAPTTAVLNSNPIISMMRSPTSLQYNAQVSARSLMSPTSPIGGIGYPTLSPFQDILSPTNNLPLWHSPSTPQLSTLGGGTGATGPSSFYKRSRLSSPTHSMPSGGVHHSNGSISGPIHLTPSNATLPVGVKEEPFYQHGMQAASSHPSATGLPPQHTLVGSPPSAKQQRHITHANANTMQQQQHQQQRHPYQQSSPQTQHVHITTTTTTMVVSPPGAHSSSSAAATADHLASHAMAHAGDHPHPHPAGLSSSSPPSINMARRRSLSMPCEIAKSSEAGIKALMDLQANWQTNNKL